MSDQPDMTPPAKPRRFPIFTVILLFLLVSGCAVYANLSFWVTNPADYQYFPPFMRSQNSNMNRHLGAEYLNIARSLVRGDGFASPFGSSTGPTAWMPPVFSWVLAALLRACNDNTDAVMTVIIFLQTYVLIATGLLVVLVARQTTGVLGSFLAGMIFFFGMICDFHNNFQFTHDCWIIMLAVDLLIAGLCWFRPLAGWTRAGFWGVFGAFCALVNPLVAAVWGVMSLVISFRQRAWARFALAVAVAGIGLPWTLRNYFAFGKLIPVKSNLAYELYQSQCLQKDGLIQQSTFSHHPYSSGLGSREGREYLEMGEVAFLEKKKAQFLEAFWADPTDFLDRMAQRFLGATLWYVPFNRTSEERQRPMVFKVMRYTHPLPFIALLVLVFTALWRPLHWSEWTVIGVYLLYLSPYIAISYYDRYAVPLLAAKTLLVVMGLDRLLSVCFRRKPKQAEESYWVEEVIEDEPDLEANGHAGKVARIVSSPVK